MHTCTHIHTHNTEKTAAVRNQTKLSVMQTCNYKT